MEEMDCYRISTKNGIDSIFLERKGIDIEKVSDSSIGANTYPDKFIAQLGEIRSTMLSDVHEIANSNLLISIPGRQVGGCVEHLFSHL